MIEDEIDNIMNSLEDIRKYLEFIQDEVEYLFSLMNETKSESE